MRLLLIHSLLLLGNLLYSFSAQTLAQQASEGKSAADALGAARKAAEDFLRKEQEKNQPAPTSAPTAQPATAQAKENLPGKAAVRDGKESADAALLPEAPPLLLPDEATRQKYLAALREYYDYRLSGYQHRRRVFEWQLISSKIIFVVVIIMVLIGVYFSWVQFRGSFARQTKASAGNENDAVTDKGLITELEASLSGIRISSPILGVIILVFSFLFFYLYLVYVYPISELF